MSRLPAEKPSPGALTGILTGELAGPVPEAVRQVAAEIRRRHAAGVDAVLFYGSCLRTGITADRVLDFYVLVRSYRATYAYRWLRALNAALPPNVFYVEVGRGPDVLRAKYAVISIADFVRAAGSRSLAPIVWARFCQPARLVYARDAKVREAVVQATHRAVLTFVGVCGAVAGRRQPPVSAGRRLADGIPGDVPDGMARGAARRHSGIVRGRPGTLRSGSAARPA